ncbi:MAG: sensor histidine kinase [Saprospiraceae bacterium]|nr:sensor histidine kinase [Saprospiraceae bacterium]
MNDISGIELKQQVSHRKWARLLFWSLFFISILSISPSSWSLAHKIMWALCIEIAFILSVYLNLRYFASGLLADQHLVPYIAKLIGLSLLLTPLLMFANQYFCRLYVEPSPAWLKDPKVNFLSMFIITAFSTIVRVPLDWIKIQKEKKELITKNVQTELQFLKNQINPHFLFNTLNNLYALTLKKSDYAPEVVLKLSDMMRYMLYECNEKWVSLSKEIQYIKNYVELERIRLSKQADITVETEGEPEGIYVAPLLFIPFIENSFKHGLKTSLDGAYIKAKFIIRSETVEFIVRNSKSQMMPGFAKKHKVGGIGLTNVRKRLELLYPDLHQLKTEESPDAYEIHLFLFLKPNSEKNEN